MKKFERLPLEYRKEEIRTAAAKLFLEKGFQSTTMENIVEQISLSKGGLYRIYPSTTAILSDIILEGMYKRNQFYRERAEELLTESKQVTSADIVNIICDSMLLFPDISALYAEFLIGKKHHPELEVLYQKICEESMSATCEMLNQLKIPEAAALSTEALWEITGLMNVAILGIVVLDYREDFSRYRRTMEAALMEIIERSVKYD